MKSIIGTFLLSFPLLYKPSSFNIKRLYFLQTIHPGYITSVISQKIKPLPSTTFALPSTTLNDRTPELSIGVIINQDIAKTQEQIVWVGCEFAKLEKRSETRSGQ